MVPAAWYWNRASLISGLHRGYSIEVAARIEFCMSTRVHRRVEAVCAALRANEIDNVELEVSLTSDTAF